MRYKIAAVADRDTVIGMALAGATYTHIHTSKEETLAKMLEFIANRDIGVILVTHKVAEELGFEISQIMRRKGLLPLVLRIPDKTGHVPRADELRDIIRRTVGTEVVLKDEGA